MANFNDFYKARDILSEILQKDLIGPVVENEVLSESPLQYYIMGKLYPKKQSSNNEDASAFESTNDSILDMAQTPLLENESSSYDSVISLSNIQNPSSMGFTFALKPETKEIKVCLTYAFYKPVIFENAKDNNIDISRWEKIEEKPDTLWVRKEYYHKKTDHIDNRIFYYLCMDYTSSLL